MAEPGGTLWLNGALVTAAQARIDPSDRGLLLGDGIFETIAVRDGYPCNLNLHFARFSAGAALLRLALPFDAPAMNAALHTVLTANNITQGALRLTLTRGTGPRGVVPTPGMTPTVMITATAMPPMTGTLSAIISQNILRDETSPLSAIKSLNYLPNILARIEAAEAGADDAILLNHAGRPAEATAGNLFILHNGVWRTPPISEGALPGIRRARLMQAGILHEARIDLRHAAAICIGNVLGLRAVVTLNGHAVATDAAAVAALSEV